MSNEIEWRPVVGFEGLYEVSSAGTVRSLIGKSPKILKPNRFGKYPHFSLRRDGKTFYRRPHCMVLSAFVGPCPDGYEGAHLDGDKWNNNLKNLDWVTPTVNQSHRRQHGTYLCGEVHQCAKLSAADVESIRSMIVDRISQSKIAKAFGVTQQMICRINKGKAWKLDRP